MGKRPNECSVNWQPDPESPGEFMDAVGAAVRNVSWHLGELATSVS